MNAEKIQELENRLGKALESMDVPEHRKNIKTIHNYKWLHKNLRTKNGENEKYSEAMGILEMLIVIKK